MRTAPVVVGRWSFPLPRGTARATAQIVESGLCPPAPPQARPSGVRYLKALEHLDLAHSKISSLPEWLGELTQLRRINIHRTPLKRKKKKIEAKLAAILPGCDLE